MIRSTGILVVPCTGLIVKSWGSRRSEPESAYQEPDLARAGMVLLNALCGPRRAGIAAALVVRRVHCDDAVIDQP